MLRVLANLLGGEEYIALLANLISFESLMRLSADAENDPTLPPSHPRLGAPRRVGLDHLQ